VLSVIITATDDTAALVRLLTLLVSGVANEVVSDAVILGATGESLDVAEDCGATAIPGDDFAEALRQARGDWLARLPLGVALTPGWIETLARHMAAAPEAAELVAEGGFLRGAGPKGWIVPRALAPSAGAVERDFQSLARRGRRLRILARR
jgi:hypothetical protein